MDYLRWAKVHPRVRFELTNSGVPTTPRTVISDDEPPPLDVRGTYGDPQLLELIGRRYGLDPTCVVPVPGASSANFIAIASALSIGDSVAVERPVYQPITRVVEFLRLHVIDLPRRPENGFAVDVNDVESALRAGARAVVLTNLHNPSGQIISRELAKDLAQRCARFDATLIVDEVYLDAHALTNNGALWSAANLGDNIIGLNSLTKVYGLSGLRIGWLLTNNILAERARNMMDLLSADNAAPSMALAIRAFSAMDRLEDRYRELYRRGQGVYREWLASEPRVSGYPSSGAIFECVRLPHGVFATALHELLTSENETQITPGSFFDLEDHIRLSTWLPADDLREALARISRALTALGASPSL